MKKLVVAQFRTGVLEQNEQAAFRSSLGLPDDTLQFINILTTADEYPEPATLAGIIVAGSGDNSLTNDHAWFDPFSSYIREVLERDIPYLGICFGHQLLAKIIGARVVRDPAQRELGTVSITLTPSGVRDPLFTGVNPTFYTIAGHNDSVVDLPQNTVALATNETCSMQAFRMSDQSTVYGVQFHPELTERDYRERLLQYRTHYEDHGSDFDELLARGRMPTNDDRVLKNFLQLAYGKF
ncbi:MAG: hypothetical protein A2677_01695 [Candidatus Komeilibacteria bacterium RIFCSPHIGHO2_01_FULL_52_14]|uniref:Glutamine amidotransferase domain-containing protein n=1 Tax=Candidatus Komeilibacteria bacterium RIFCSPHIGHO2_01_FULL_52_14 TaxID=1798549 RepID=A0A1G2BMM5_9BACT|nr:MAG: hypothetical protein A2677_01695 [Candidatus Komeilibacteria bacterium RIFCSPHIGHO2_01_FULL_52_14]